jgi:hypothetical protein
MRAGQEERAGTDVEALGSGVQLAVDNNGNIGIHVVVVRRHLSAIEEGPCREDIRIGSERVQQMRNTQLSCKASAMYMNNLKRRPKKKKMQRTAV